LKTGERDREKKRDTDIDNNEHCDSPTTTRMKHSFMSTKKRQNKLFSNDDDDDKGSFTSLGKKRFESALIYVW